jgi:hypothetical protein
MRVVSEIPHPEFKITLFAWNNRYLIKLEQGLLEQTYKVSETDVAGDEDVLTLLDDEFLREAGRRFHEMSRSLGEAMKRHGM